MPYSAHVTLPEGDGRALIEHVRGMELLSEQKDALGRILYLDEANAVLMTYYRNNILHIFALPALLASFFTSSARMSRELLGQYVHALYPYLQAELFLRWTPEALDEAIDQWLAALVEQGLLREENGVYLRPAPSSRQFVMLTLLARAITQTLQRFYMATSLLLNSGQHSLDAEELEALCVMMAQRLSILHGLNAPEFFDKTLFRRCSVTSSRPWSAKACCNRTTVASWATTTSSANCPKGWPSACCRRSCACRSARWRCIGTIPPSRDRVQV